LTEQFDFRAARLSLGLSLKQMGDMLDTDRRAVSRFEASPETSTHREPAVRVRRLMQAYLDGYRPSDWPDNTEGNTHEHD
jgi:hypothetical protein